MVKRKPKKAKNVDPLIQERIDKLSQVLDAFKSEVVRYEKHLESTCRATCFEIEKMYMDRLRSIPENIRNMTIAEVMQSQQKEEVRETECPRNENAFRMMHERAKLTSERKRTQRKEKKRSISAPATARNMSLARQNPNPNNTLLNRTGSDLSLFTPAKQRKPSMVVTPKFDPKRPVLQARKPKPGEVLMSLSGSPLQNVMDELPSDRIALSLGQGRVITFGENVEIDSEMLRSIDEPLKTTIHKVQQQLNEILRN